MDTPEAQPQVGHIGLVDVVAVWAGPPVLRCHPVLLASVRVAAVQHAIARDLAQVRAAHLPHLQVRAGGCARMLLVMKLSKSTMPWPGTASMAARPISERCSTLRVLGRSWVFSVDVIHGTRASLRH